MSISGYKNRNPGFISSNIGTQNLVWHHTRIGSDSTAHHYHPIFFLTRTCIFCGTMLSQHTEILIYGRISSKPQFNRVIQIALPYFAALGTLQTTQYTTHGVCRRSWILVLVCHHNLFTNIAMATDLLDFHSHEKNISRFSPGTSALMDKFIWSI